MRIYESCGRRTTAEIKTGFDIKEAAETSFIETEDFADITAEGNSFKITMKPFEIKTIRVKKA